MKRLLVTVPRFFASTKLSIVLILCLFVLTLLGTLAQVDLGLREAQRTYFDSWWLLQPVYGVDLIPLPGGLLVMSMLFVNLLVGGIFSMRKRWSRAGVLIAHVGIAMILVSGLVRFVLAEEGGMRLYVGNSAREYGSYHDWEIAIAQAVDGDRIIEHIIPGQQFTSDGTWNFRHTGLQLEMQVSRFEANCEPALAAKNGSSAPVLDGFFLDALDLDTLAENNTAGCYVRIRSLSGTETQEGMLWGGAHYPFTVDLGGERLGISLRKKRIDLPFKVTLEKTDRELLPGISTPKAFSSDVLITDGEVEQRAHISMNQPLRYKGFVFYQSGWGEANPKTSMQRFSFLAVARNPADAWPLWSCVIITIGLVMHFGRVLYRYIRTELGRARC